jgi:hypothetical protein
MTTNQQINYRVTYGRAGQPLNSHIPASRQTFATRAEAEIFAETRQRDDETHRKIHRPNRPKHVYVVIETELPVGFSAKSQESKYAAMEDMAAMEDARDRWVDGKYSEPKEVA